MAKARRDLPDTRKVWSGYLAEIWDAGLQIHERAHDHQLDKVARLGHRFTRGGLYSVQTTYWILMHTRPDTENALSQFMSNNYGLRVTSSSGVMLSGYADSDWASNVVNHKSTSNYCSSMGSAMISWASR